MREITLAYALITLYFFFIGLFFFYNWRRQVTIRDKSSVKIKGIVIGYKKFQRTHKPIVEYYVDGKRYRQYLRYYLRRLDKSDVFFTYETEEEIKREILRDRYIFYANPINYNFKKYWPIGSTMTVYYNPKNPKLAYVERYGGLLHYFRNATILVFIGWPLVMSIIYYLVG